MNKIEGKIEEQLFRLQVDYEHIGPCDSFAIDQLACGCVRVGDDAANVVSTAMDIYRRLADLPGGAGWEATWAAFEDLEEGADCQHGN